MLNLLDVDTAVIIWMCLLSVGLIFDVSGILIMALIRLTSLLIVTIIRMRAFYAKRKQVEKAKALKAEQEIKKVEEAKASSEEPRAQF